MSRIRIHCFSVSRDGYGAGPAQSRADPLGRNGERLHEWVFGTAHGRSMIGDSGGTTGVDESWLRRGDDGIGATLMGRNMFGPVRGPWPDESWQGWWGPVPPYGHDVVVLTHYPRADLPMAGGTTFRFETGGLDAGLESARAAAGDLDVRVGGGVSVVREVLRRGLADEIHVAVAPVELGAGERMWDTLDGWPRGYDLVERAQGESVEHLRWTRAADFPTARGDS